MDAPESAAGGSVGKARGGSKNGPCYDEQRRQTARQSCNRVLFSTDLTYIPMRRSFIYLVAVLDWHSRRDLSWRVSNTLTTDFCLDAVRCAIIRYGMPDIFNIDQRSQLTSREFTRLLKEYGIQISMDGKTPDAIYFAGLPQEEIAA